MMMETLPTEISNSFEKKKLSLYVPRAMPGLSIPQSSKADTAPSLKELID